MWRINKQSLIGCDVGPTSVRVAQLRSGRDGDELILQHQPLPQPEDPTQQPPVEAVSSLIADLLGSGAFRGRKAVTCLNPDLLTYRTMRMAEMADSELQSAAHWKLASELKLKTDEFQSQLLTTRPVKENGASKIELVAVAAANDILLRQSDMLAGAGLDLVAIDASTSAIARCFVGWTPSALMLELQQRSAILAAIDQGELLLVRLVGRGTDLLEELLARRLEIDAHEAAVVHRLLLKDGSSQWLSTHCTRPQAVAALDDAAGMYARELAREVSLSLRYYEDALGSALCERGFVVGNHQLPAGAYSALATQTGIGFAPLSELPNPQWQAACTASGSPNAGDWLTAIGLAQYDTSPAAMRREAA